MVQLSNSSSTHEARPLTAREILETRMGTPDCKQSDTLHALLRGNTTLPEDLIADAAYLPAAMQHRQFDAYCRENLAGGLFENGSFVLQVKNGDNLEDLRLVEIGRTEKARFRELHFKFKIDSDEFMASSPAYEREHLEDLRTLALEKGLPLRNSLVLSEEPGIEAAFLIAAIASQAQEAGPNIFKISVKSTGNDHWCLVPGKELVPSLGKLTPKEKLDFIAQNLSDCLNDLGSRITNPQVALAALAERAGLSYILPDSNSFLMLPERSLEAIAGEGILISYTPKDKGHSYQIERVSPEEV